MSMPSFTLSFSDAMDALVHDGYYIQGCEFKSGVYLKVNKENGIIMVVDANNKHSEFPLQLTTGVYKQTYRKLSIGNQAIY